MTLRLRLALRIPVAVGLTVTALAQAPVAHGEDAPLAPIPPPPPANMNTLTPPRLVTFVDANYPEAARTAHLQANVELELMIDVAGKVTEARVVAPVGNGFDAAAIEAARRFVFEPAKRGDHAIPDAAGTFQFQELPPGRYHLKLAASGLAPLAVDEEVTVGDLTSVTYRLQGVGAPRDETALEFGATATVEGPPREVTKRSLSGDELLRVAGTRGDPLRAIPPFAAA